MAIQSHTWQFLTDPTMRALCLPAIACGGAIAILCGSLSSLVVLKRLAFVGQGISHAAFGGAGLVAALGLAASAGAAGHAAQFAGIFVFCLAAAMLIGSLSQRGRTGADTAIGIVLVTSMAVGAILLRRGSGGVSWESFLFGDIFAVTWTDALIAWGITLLVALALWLVRRPLLFWAFDPGVARALGVRDTMLHFLVMAMLALATVTAMKLAGVVLATALLVLPGAFALRVTRRWGVVRWLTPLAALAGVAAGLTLSFENDWPPGPSIVCVLAAAFGLSLLRPRATTA